MKLYTMAWRNVRRNSRRSALSAAAIALAGMTIVLLFSLLAGMTQDMANNLIDFYMGEIRIRHSDYDKNASINPLHLSIEDSSALIAELAGSNAYSTMSPRISFPAAVFEDDETTGFMALGMDLNSDPMHIEDYLIEGRLPEPQRNEVVLGKRAAKNLGLGVGQRFTALSNTLRRSSNAMTFLIVGIVELPLSEMNGRVFLDIERTRYFLRMGDRSVDILLKIAPGVSRAEAMDTAQTILAGQEQVGIQAQYWKDIPSSYMLLSIAQVAYYIIGLVFYVLASTVIINTIMMTVIERTKEIGTLGAMGMEKRHIVRLFLLESAFISLIGSAVGVAIGSLLSYYWQVNGLDMTEAMSGVDFEISNIIHLKLTVFNMFFSLLSGVAVASLISLIPSRKAASIQPVEALRN